MKTYGYPAIRTQRTVTNCRYRCLRNTRLARTRGGSALLVVLILTGVALGLSLALTEVSVRELNSSTESLQREQALAAADAGIDYAAWQIQNSGANAFWSPSGATLTSVIPNSGGASFSVTLAPDNSAAYSGAVDVTSTATVGPQTITVGAVVQTIGEDVSVWHNAIFAGTGQASGSINGNCSIVGPIHVLGTGLTSSSVAIDFGGGASQLDNYVDGNLPGAFGQRIPPLPVVNGLSTISAKLRVKHGMVNLSGSSEMGDNSPSTGNKGTLDASYVTDGFGGTAGSSHLYSDQPNQAYDLGNAVSFPSLLSPVTALDPVTGTTRTWTSWLSYYSDSDIAYQYTGGSITVTAATCPTLPYYGIFGSTSGSNPCYIKYYRNSNGDAILELHGIIHVASGSITIGTKGDNFFFSGSGTLVAGGTASGTSISNPGNITINCNLLSLSKYANGTGGFPLHDVIGLVAPGNLSLGPGAQQNVMGACYCAGLASVGKQTNLAGAIVANTFDTSNPPNLFYVPPLPGHLPPGMPGSGSILTVNSTKLVAYWKQ